MDIIMYYSLLYIDLRPGQTCHSKYGRSDTFRWPVMGRNRVGGLGWQYGTRCRHKVMHRKRVTSELHDSYFCLMMIKHAILRMAEVTHSDGQLWEEIAYAGWADNMGQDKNPTLPSQSDAPDESDLWTAWQLFPLDDDQTCHSKDSGSDILMASYGEILSG